MAQAPPLTLIFVRREALLIRVEVRDHPPLTLSQQGGEAGGSLIREAPGRVGAALTKPGRASTARWCGSGERGGEEYARNQRYYVLHKRHRLEPGGSGPGAARSAGRDAAGTSGACWSPRAGRPRGSLRRTRGEAAGTQPGSSSAERTTVNTGTARAGSRRRASGPLAGIGAPTAERAGRGGAAVVLRAGESP